MKMLPLLLAAAGLALMDVAQVQPAAAPGDAPANQWGKQEKAMNSQVFVLRFDASSAKLETVK